MQKEKSADLRTYPGVGNELNGAEKSWQKQKP